MNMKQANLCKLDSNIKEACCTRASGVKSATDAWYDHVTNGA